MRSKLIVILGPTASGKTKLGVALAAQFNGEIVSADSRQVYKGMDVGSGKDLKEFKIKNVKSGMICYHMIDVASPKRTFSVAQYQKKAYVAIEDILKHGKLPIVVGGSGLYLEALIDGYDLATRPRSANLAQKENLHLEAWQARFKKKYSQFFSRLNQSDSQNKRRLSRYWEILEQGGDPYEKKRIKQNLFKPLVIGIKVPPDQLEFRIRKRLKERLEKEGMIDEVKNLRASGLSWRRLESFGLEYKYLAWYLQDKLDYDEMQERLAIAIRQFAKKQMTWFRRWEKNGAKINWVKSADEAERQVKCFMEQ